MSSHYGTKDNRDNTVSFANEILNLNTNQENAK